MTLEVLIEVRESLSWARGIALKHLLSEENNDWWNHIQGVDHTLGELDKLIEEINMIEPNLATLWLYRDSNDLHTLLGTLSAIEETNEATLNKRKHEVTVEELAHLGADYHTLYNAVIGALANGVLKRRDERRGKETGTEFTPEPAA